MGGVARPTANSASQPRITTAKAHFHIANLDAALTIIEKVGILYENLERSDQKELLRQMVERVIVDPEGRLIRLELKSPFSYLHRVSEQVEHPKNEDAVTGNEKASSQAGLCSDYVSLGVGNGTRTHSLLNHNQML